MLTWIYRVKGTFYVFPSSLTDSPKPLSADAVHSVDYPIDSPFVTLLLYHKADGSYSVVDAVANMKVGFFRYLLGNHGSDICGSIMNVSKFKPLRKFAPSKTFTVNDVEQDWYEANMSMVFPSVLPRLLDAVRKADLPKRHLLAGVILPPVIFRAEQKIGFANWDADLLHLRLRPEFCQTPEKLNIVLHAEHAKWKFQDNFADGHWCLPVLYSMCALEVLSPTATTYSTTEEISKVIKRHDKAAKVLGESTDDKIVMTNKSIWRLAGALNKGVKKGKVKVHVVPPVFDVISEFPFPAKACVLYLSGRSNEQRTELVKHLCAQHGCVFLDYHDRVKISPPDSCTSLVILFANEIDHWNAARIEEDVTDFVSRNLPVILVGNPDILPHQTSGSVFADLCAKLAGTDHKVYWNPPHSLRLRQLDAWNWFVGRRNRRIPDGVNPPVWDDERAAVVKGSPYVDKVADRIQVCWNDSQYVVATCVFLSSDAVQISNENSLYQDVSLNTHHSVLHLV